MSNTIDLLESIGTDASLRHASGSDMEKMLETMQATDELKRAARTGNPEPLKQELGDKSMNVNQNPHNTGCPEDEEEGKEPPQHEDDEKDEGTK